METDTAPLVLHSSPIRLTLQASTPVLLGILGGAAATRGINGVVLAMLLAAVVTLAVVLFDLPIRSELDRDGITRVCLLRRQRLSWSEVVAIERMPRGVTRRAPAASDPAAAPPGVARSRGLVARVGPRRMVLLVDRRESHAEHAALRALVRDRATTIRAEQPPIDATPAGRGPRALHRR